MRLILLALVVAAAASGCVMPSSGNGIVPDVELAEDLEDVHLLVTCIVHFSSESDADGHEESLPHLRSYVAFKDCSTEKHDGALDAATMTPAFTRDWSELYKWCPILAVDAYAADGTDFQWDIGNDDPVDQAAMYLCVRKEEDQPCQIEFAIPVTSAGTYQVRFVKEDYHLTKGWADPTGGIHLHVTEAVYQTYINKAGVVQ